MKIHTKNHVIKREGKPYVIAEIGSNAMRCLNIAKEMIRIAAQVCHVNAVKFQKRYNSAVYTKEMYNSPYNSIFGTTYGEHREHLEFSVDEYAELINCAKENNVDFIVTIFDDISLEQMCGLDIDGYKISSGDITNTLLIEKVAKLGKPIFISTGAATLEEVEKAIEIAKINNDKVIILHCVSQYPTDYENMNLNIIKDYLKRFPDHIIGYSSHDIGLIGAISAYVLGANVIEKHFTLDNNLYGTDHKLSLNVQQMRELVQELKRVASMLGTSNKKLNEYEMPARIKLGKSIYTSREIKKGEKITLDNICIKSPGGFLPPYLLKTIIGQKVNSNIGEEKPLTELVLTESDNNL